MEYGNNMDSFWGNLSRGTQEAIMEFLGDNGDSDGYPSARIYRGEETVAYA